MLNLAVVVFLLQIRAPIASDASGSVRGVVRSDATAVGVSAARVEMLDAQDGVFSDSVGAYVLQRLTPGAHRLRFSARGFEPLAIDVLVVPGIPLTLDVNLSPVPATLVSVRIFAPARAQNGDTSSISLEGGSWGVSGEQIRGSPMFADADALRLLAASPQAHMATESAPSVHVRGGSADQNLFLLDGAPVYSPVHPGHLLSAFSPDIIDTLVLHGGAPSARYGGQLSSVVDIRTPTSIPPRFETRGAFGPTAARSSIYVPMFTGRGAFTLSARHSYSGLRRQDLGERSMPGTWFDLFGKLSLGVGKNRFTVLSFVSDNGLGFPSSASSSEGVRRAVSENNFEWTSATQSATWRRSHGDRTRFEAVAWRARFDGAAVWNPDNVSLGLYNAVRDVGLSGTLGISHGAGRFTSGFQIERFSSSYVVLGYDSVLSPSSDPSLLRRSSRPLIASLFAEERWTPSRDWTVAAGLRGTLISGLSARGEPRVSLAFHPAERLGLSVGYARMHQYNQSLRGEESFLGNVVGPDFLVGVAEGVPTASSNELTASVSVPVNEQTQVRFDWYMRRLRNLILPASGGTEPFVSRSYATGSGQASGFATSLETRVRSISLNAVYSLAFVRRTTDSAVFDPSFAPRQTASLAVEFDATPRTNIHSVFWLAAGRPTTTQSDDIGWDTRDSFSGAREVTGSPHHTEGSLDGARLPLYLRFDVGARHTMSLRRAEVTGFAGVNNTFGRKNKIGYVQPPGTNARRDLGMLPASIVLGLEWHY